MSPAGQDVPGDPGGVRGVLAPLPRLLPLHLLPPQVPGRPPAVPNLPHKK